MKSTEQSSLMVDTWIAEEELPVSACLKVIRTNDPNFGLTEDEILERNEFIHWYLLQDFTLLMMIPTQTAGNDFFAPDCDVDCAEYSAFNTHDFERTQRPFDKYGYAMSKIMERVKDLAILHSVINSPERRLSAYTRYETLIELEFRNRLFALVERCKGTSDPERKLTLKQKIGELNRRILEAKGIWEQYAPWDS